MNEFGTVLLVGLEPFPHRAGFLRSIASGRHLTAATLAINDAGFSPGILLTPDDETGNTVAKVLESLAALPEDVVSDDRLNRVPSVYQPGAGPAANARERITDFYAEALVPVLLQRETALVVADAGVLDHLRSALNTAVEIEHQPLVPGNPLVFEFDDSMHPRHPSGEYLAPF